MGLTRDEAMQQWLSNPETREWIESRPESVRALIEQMPPGTWWTMKTSGHALYTPISYSEDGTLTVQRHDPLFGGFLDYGVFGCHPEDFEWTPLTPKDAALLQ